MKRLPVVLLAFAAFIAHAATLDDAIRAESDKRWADALEVYAAMLAREPARADVWLRVADVHAVQGNASQAADAVGQAARLREGDAALQARWSQSLAVANRPDEALAAMQRAVALEPGNTDYLAAQAQLATWSGNDELAVQTYNQWLEQSPGDNEPMLRWARVVARQGDLDRAVEMYETTLRGPEPDQSVRLELARVHAYRGDYSSAREQVRLYRDYGGGEAEHVRALAELESRAGNPRRALELLQSIPDAEDDYELQLIRTSALHANNDYASAADALVDLERLGPQRPETAGMRLQVETPKRHTLSGRAQFYADSLELQQLRYGLAAGIQSGPRWRWKLEAERVDTSAELGSGLETRADELSPSSARSSVDVDRVNIGVRYDPAPVAGLELGGGIISPELGSDLAAYQAAIHLRPLDGLRLQLRAERDLLLVSPRAIEYNIERRRGRVLLNSQLGDRLFIDIEGNADEYSDGNRSIEGLFGPRFAVVRNQYFNLDLGARAHVVRHNADAGSAHLQNEQTGGSGYYTPDLFRRYWATAFVYGKLGDNAGVAIGGGYGVEQDKDLDDEFQTAGDVSVEGIFGIYRDWQLRIWGGAGGRVDSAGFQAGSYNGRSAGIEIMRRF